MLAMGYSPAGGLMPAQIGMAYWNQFNTWADAVAAMTWWKQVADLWPALAGQNITPKLNQGGVYKAYGHTVKNPKQGCNNFGVLMYRYYFPTWDPTLFPQQGAQTHFLGRYIFKNGFPNQGSTMQDMTPAGGYLTEGQRMVANFYPNTGGTYIFQIACDDQVRMQVNGQVIATVYCCGNQTNSSPVTMIAGQVYPLIIDIWNGGGPWSFTIQMAIDGGAWQPLPLQQLYMTQDRRLPTFELAFNKMSAGFSGPVNDTNNVFQNLLMTGSVGSLGGKTCMLVNGNGVVNYANFSQGVRGRAFKSYTMMVQVTSISPSTGGIALFEMYNTGSSNTTAYPRKGAPQDSVDWDNRPQNLMCMTYAGNILFEYQDKNIPNQGQATPAAFAYGQWNHVAIVWNEDFTGCAVYVNGALATQFYETGPPITTMLEQMRIGSNTNNGTSWAGGVAWFRAFDYQLSTDLIKMDMNDGWANLI
jgi:hypothetical protein